jgi:hypothetical protein
VPLPNSFLIVGRQDHTAESLSAATIASMFPMSDHQQAREWFTCPAHTWKDGSGRMPLQQATGPRGLVRREITGQLAAWSRPARLRVPSSPECSP